MPRANTRPSDALQTGFGIQEGTVQVVGAKYKIIQHSRTDGTPVTPFLGMEFELLKLDEDLRPIDGDVEDTSIHEFPISWGRKRNGAEFDLSAMKFHPGEVSGPDDENPEDLGVGVGTSGNSLWVENPSTVPFRDCDWIFFLESLEKKGFKPEINYQCYAPNYIGLVCDVHTVNRPLGRNAKPGDIPPTAWECTKIHVYGKKKAAGKSVAASSSPAANDGPAEPETVNTFLNVMKGNDKIIGVAARNVGKEVDFDRLGGICMPVMTALKIPLAQQRKLMEALKSSEFLLQVGPQAGVLFDAASKRVGF